MKISILTDNPTSWIIPYADELARQLYDRGHEVVRCAATAGIPKGECAFFLGCEKIIPKEILRRNMHNLVVHESTLPKGKGWSPLTWQILEGKHDIPITLFEAAKKVDSGRVYLSDVMRFNGHELIDELRKTQGEKTIALVLAFVDVYPPQEGHVQKGKESFYPRRAPKDSMLNPLKTIAEQFDLLRVIDNERYPAFFDHRGHRYLLKIEKDKRPL